MHGGDRRANHPPKRGLTVADGSFGPILSAQGLPAPYYAMSNGVLFEGDCLEIVPRLPPSFVNTVFAAKSRQIGKILTDC